MENKTVLITGGTSGIGLETAVAFAKANWNVYITARDETKGEEAVKSIIDDSKNQNVKYIVGDLSSIASVKKLSASINDQVKTLNVLINNAGISPFELEVNPDGYEMSFMVNCLAVYILSEGLKDLLKKSEKSRIINVNTQAHYWGSFNIEKTPYGLDFLKSRTYSNTKVANAMLTISLSEEFGKDGITVNAFHPGIYNTKLLKSLFNGMFSNILSPILMPFTQNISKSGEAPLYLASDTALDNVTGQFFNKKKKSGFSSVVLNKEKRDILFEKIKEWTNQNNK